jgi:hypothetical protein
MTPSIEPLPRPGLTPSKHLRFVPAHAYASVFATPDYTRWQGFTGADGEGQNEKTPGNPGVFSRLLFFETGPIGRSGTSPSRFLF